MQTPSEWTTEFYVTVHGSSPVEEFLDGLDLKTRASMMPESNIREGQRRYEEYWARQMADPEFRRVYAEEAKKKALWLQLVEARQVAGLTQQQVAERMGVSQAQVARIERQGYDAYTLRTLRRYLEALGDEFSLEIAVVRDEMPAHPVSS